MIKAHKNQKSSIEIVFSGLRSKRTELLLFATSSGFQIKANFAFNLEIEVLASGGRLERIRRLHRIYKAKRCTDASWWASQHTTYNLTCENSLNQSINSENTYSDYSNGPSVALQLALEQLQSSVKQRLDI